MTGVLNMESVEIYRSLDTFGNSNIFETFDYFKIAIFDKFKTDCKIIDGKIIGDNNVIFAVLKSDSELRVEMPEICNVPIPNGDNLLNVSAYGNEEEIMFCRFVLKTGIAWYKITDEIKQMVLEDIKVAEKSQTINFQIPPQE